MSGDGSAGHHATQGPSSTTLDGLARGRRLFNRGDFWGAHEALERAWRDAEAEERAFLQGLILLSAAFHKLVVQGEPRGSRRLLENARARLEPLPSGYAGLDVRELEGQVRSWLERLSAAPEFGATVAGLPRMEWAPDRPGDGLQIEAIELFAVEPGDSRAILVALSTRGSTGWGEVRHAWGAHGLWDDLALGLAPALLAETFRMPGELAEALKTVEVSSAASAGAEAAAWDLWSRLRDEPLYRALGFAGRPVPQALRVDAGDTESLASRTSYAWGAGYAMLVLPARPNADRRVLPKLAAESRGPFAIDLGGAYRPADIAALRVIDRLDAVMLVDPAPRDALASAVTLRRWLTTPVALTRPSSLASAESALGIGALDIIGVDPGVCGLTEARDIAELAGASGTPLWVVGSAATGVGAASDLAYAAHPSATIPADLSSARTVDGVPVVTPDGEGCAVPYAGPGSGPPPSRTWLRQVTRRHVALYAGDRR